MRKCLRTLRCKCTCFQEPMFPAHLKEERDFIMCIAKIPLNKNNHTHTRLLCNLFTKLNNPGSSPPHKQNPAAIQWELIGFQSNNPKTDLRGVGILPLLQTLNLLELYLDFARKVYRHSLHQTYNFPFMCVAIDISKIGTILLFIF
jgi:ELMO domain-containing protein